MVVYVALTPITNRLLSGVLRTTPCWFGTKGSESLHAGSPRLAEVSVSRNTMGHPLGYDLSRPAVLAHYAGVMDASIGSPVMVR